MHDDRGRLVVRTTEVGGIFGASSTDGLVRYRPAAALTLLIGQPADRCRIDRLPGSLERREGEALNERAGVVVAQLLLCPEQSGVRSRGLFRSQQPRYEVGPCEVGRVDAHGVRIKNQIGQPTGSVGVVDRDVRAGVGFEVGQGCLRSRRVDVGGRQGQNAARCGRSGPADAAVGRLLTGDPGGRRLGCGELWNLGLHRRGTGRGRERRQCGGSQQHGEANGGCTQEGAADDLHGSRFPDLDPENSARAGSHRAPVPVSRRWELS